MGELDLIRAQPDDLLPLVIWLVIFAMPVLGRILQALQKRGSSASSKSDPQPRRRARDEWARRIREAMEEAGAEFPQPTPVADRSQPKEEASSAQSAPPAPEPRKKREQHRSVFAEDGGGGALSEPFSNSLSGGRGPAKKTALGGAFDNEMPALAERGAMGGMRSPDAARGGSAAAPRGGLGGSLRPLPSTRSQGTLPANTTRARGRFRSSWAEAIVRAEILGPPVALRADSHAATNPGLGGGGAPVSPPGLS